MTKIELKGDLSIGNAEELHKVFKSAVQKNADIELDISQLEDIDASIIQLVIALYRALNGERTITISGPVSETVKRRLYISGILPTMDIDNEKVTTTVKERMEAIK